MKKIVIISLLLGISLHLLSQNTKSEYRYLKIIKSQSKQLIKGNLRNAELKADQLIYSKVDDSLTASLFFMELGDNYTKLKRPGLALFSYLRQRFCFPNDSIGLYVEKQIRQNALRLNLDKQTSDYLILKSAPQNRGSNREEQINKLIYWTIKIETKYLSDILLHQIDMMNSEGMSENPYILKWEDVSRLEIPLKFKSSYLEKNFNELTIKQQKRYYRYQANYYLRHKAWKRAEASISNLSTIYPGKTKSLLYLKLRMHWHF
jgi:hypothetical protein